MGQQGWDLGGGRFGFLVPLEIGLCVLDRRSPGIEVDDQWRPVKVDLGLEPAVACLDGVGVGQGHFSTQAQMVYFLLGDQLPLQRASAAVGPFSRLVEKDLDPGLGRRIGRAQR